MYIFNKHWNNNLRGFSSTLLLFPNEVQLEVATSGIGKLMEIRGDSFKSEVISEIILLPNDFDAKYEEFWKENQKMLGVLSNKYGVNKNTDITKFFYIFTDGSKNFFQWAVKLYWQCGISLYTIKNIMIWNDCFGHLSKNLSRGTITAYTNVSAIGELMVSTGMDVVMVCASVSMVTGNVRVEPFTSAVNSPLAGVLFVGRKK